MHLFAIENLIDVRSVPAVVCDNVTVFSSLNFQSLLVCHLNCLKRQLIQIIAEASVINEKVDDVFVRFRTIGINESHVLQQDSYTSVVFLVHGNM